MAIKRVRKKHKFDGEEEGEWVGTGMHPKIWYHRTGKPHSCHAIYLEGDLQAAPATVNSPMMVPFLLLWGMDSFLRLPKSPELSNVDSATNW